MKKFSCNICLIIVFVIYTALLVINNVGRATVSFVVEEGSYADDFAKENHLPKAEITDDLRSSLDVRFAEDDVEVVKVNLQDEKGNYLEVTKGGITLRVYDDGTVTNGSEEIDVHPTIVTTTTVMDIDTVYVVQPGDTLSDISDSTGVGVYEIAEKNNIQDINLIYANVELRIPSEQQITEITTITKNASVENEEAFNYVTSPMSECEFGYNIVNDNVELVYYYGSDKELIIPSHISGYPVTTIKFDLVGEFDVVVIPKTVTSITGEVSRITYTSVFFIEIIFSILAFILVAIAVNIVFSRLKNEGEFVLSGPQLILAFVYLIFQLVFSILSIYYYVPVTPFVALVVSAVAFAFYLVTIIMAGAGREHAIKEEKSTKIKTSVMKQIKLECEGLADDVLDDEIKKMVIEFTDDVRYSPLGSSLELDDIEDDLMSAVEKLGAAIERGKEEEIKECCMLAKKILKKRNRLVKANV